MKHLRIALVTAASLGLSACAEVDPGPSGATSSAAAVEAGERYIIKYRDRGRALDTLRGAGARIARELPAQAAIAAHVPSHALARLASDPNVEYVEPDAKRYPLAQTIPYGIDMVQATDPAFSGAGAGTIEVCVIDSGFWTGHEDLAGIPVTGEAGTAWDQDGCGHGTHVAGTIAALNNDRGVVGVAPQGVTLHIVRVFGDDCSWSYASDLVAAVDECRAAGAKVINMSLGGSTASRFEQSAFDQAWAAGVISVAAAGNDGNTRHSYPASYSSVVSVAALDRNKQVAAFSQKNDEVDLAAPGVSVLSTVPWLSRAAVTVDAVAYAANGMEGAPSGTASGPLADGGLCDSTGSWTGKVVLCQRGTITFADKVRNVQAGGGVAAIIYNNVSGGFSGTLGDFQSAIVAVSVSMEDGQFLVANKLGATAMVESTFEAYASGYESWDGTSMATPHVAGVAALVWSHFPTRANADVRAALEATAQDLGAAGRDNEYGHGLVQAKAAYDALAGGGTCTPDESTELSCDDGRDNDCDGLTDGSDPDCMTCFPSGASCTSGSDCCSGKCRGKPGGKTCR